MKRFITEAVFPAGLYGIQNVAYLMAVQTLDPLTFNVLAQTKTLTVVGCFDNGRRHFYRLHWILGKKLQRMGLASCDARSIAHFAVDLHLGPCWSTITGCSATQKFVHLQYGALCGTIVASGDQSVFLL